MERLVRERAIALGHAIDPRTHLAYSSHLRSYFTFCKLHGFSIEPTIDTLSFYTIYMSCQIQPRSVNSYLSGISHELEHVFPEIRQNRKSSLVTRTLKGAMKLYSNPIKRKRPLTIEDLSVLLLAFPPTSHDNLLFSTILLSGFFALHRLGELTIPDNPALLESRKIIRRSSVTLSPSQYGYNLPAHKGDKFFASSDVLVAESSDQINPLAIFQLYLNSRDSLFPFHFQLFLTSDGSPPSRTWFLSRLQSILHDNVAGHSLRSGGATYFASCGWPDEQIQKLGRWSTRQFESYVRTHPVILQALLHSRHPEPSMA
ncbi:hypothetical protein NLI96_g9890 [Meripilus lineatus]|uniref:Uncharacterized protein n=1 Tax=Meripilus lineatus TaxID=2056292 RepID=A0AAD5YET6_9APHY|nr:hypothetical protein NLI96_g9890 [Physisporinus lineatus]